MRSQRSPLNLTLCLSHLQDSGWYTANYSAADGLLPGADWGFQQGCSFALDKCLYESGGQLVGQGVPPHFYSTDRNTGLSNAVCMPDRSAVAYVSITTGGSVPVQFQYFPDPTMAGGAPTVADYCPFIQGYSNRLCTDASVQDSYTCVGSERRLRI